MGQCFLWLRCYEFTTPELLFPFSDLSLLCLWILCFLCILFCPDCFCNFHAWIVDSMWTLSIDSGFEIPVTRQVGEVEGLKIQNNLKLDPSHANGEGRQTLTSGTLPFPEREPEKELSKSQLTGSEEDPCLWDFWSSCDIFSWVRRRILAFGISEAPVTSSAG